jgi:hypothetical protein
MAFTPIDPNIIDYTNMSTLIANVGGIFPGFVSLISAIVGPWIILAVIGLVMGLFGAITGGFREMFSAFR